MKVQFSFESEEPPSSLLQKCNAAIEAASKVNLPFPEEITVIFVSDEYIKSLNQKFREIDRPTDVLTFSYDNLAEIYISLDTAKKQAAEFSHEFSAEVALLLVHGLLHATGLDHEKSEADAKQMRFLEKQILEDAKIPINEVVTVPHGRS